MDLALHCDVMIASDRARFRVPELLRGIPDPLMSARLVEVVGLARARVPVLHRGRDRRRRGGRDGPRRQGGPPRRARRRHRADPRAIANTGPLARAAIKRDLNAELRPGDVSLFMVPGLSAEITEGMGAFVEKRACGMATSVNRSVLTPVDRAGHRRHRRGRSTASTCVIRSATPPRAAARRAARALGAVLPRAGPHRGRAAHVRVGVRLLGQYPLTKMFGGTAMSSTIEDMADSPPMPTAGTPTYRCRASATPGVPGVNAKVIPRGGDTMWASLSAADHAFSPAMQDLLLPAHRAPPLRRRLPRSRLAEHGGGSRRADRWPSSFVQHPLAHSDPVTGRRALFVSGLVHGSKIVGMRRDESAMALGSSTTTSRTRTSRCAGTGPRATSRCGP